MRNRLTKERYEQFLNEALTPDYESEDWIIGGSNRNYYYNRYGTALRKHDPIAFEVGYNEWTNGINHIIKKHRT